jgi:hypothetical protein
MTCGDPLFHPANAPPPLLRRTRVLSGGRPPAARQAPRSFSRPASGLFRFSGCPRVCRSPCAGPGDARETPAGEADSNPTLRDRIPEGQWAEHPAPSAPDHEEMLNEKILRRL